MRTLFLSEVTAESGLDWLNILNNKQYETAKTVEGLVKDLESAMK